MTCHRQSTQVPSRLRRAYATATLLVLGSRHGCDGHFPALSISGGHINVIRRVVHIPGQQRSAIPSRVARINKSSPMAYLANFRNRHERGSASHGLMCRRACRVRNGALLVERLPLQPARAVVRLRTTFF